MMSTHPKKKIIVTVAPTSNFHGKDANPALPCTPAEIADAVYDCYNAGAAVVHLHARDEHLVQSNDVNIFRDMNDRIRAKCSIILQNSTAPAVKPGAVEDDGLSVLDAGCEMCSIDCGILHLKFGELQIFNKWTRDWLVSAAQKALDRGIKPELEIFNPSNLEDVIHILKPAGVLPDPISLTFVMGMGAQGAQKFTPENLMHLVRMTPDRDFLWGAMGVGGANQHKATCMALALGGNVRVGFEDNIYYRPGELAKSNAQLVERIVTTARDMGYDIASPDEARAILGIQKK